MVVVVFFDTTVVVVVAAATTSPTHSIPEENGRVANVPTQFDEDGRFLIRDQVGDDAAFVFADVDKKVMGAGEVVDGGEEGGWGPSHLGERRVGVDVVGEGFFAAVMGLEGGGVLSWLPYLAVSGEKGVEAVFWIGCGRCERKTDLHIVDHGFT